MPEVSFLGLVIVCAVAFLVPLALGLNPRLRLPSVVLEIVAGIAIGPSGLGWVDPDLPIAILSVMGLAFLLFLAGLEIELDRFMGRFLQKAVLGLLLSFALGIVVSYGLGTVGVIETPLFVAIVLLATSLGLVIPVLRDAGENSTDFGQLTIAGSAFADFAAVILLSLFFSREATGPGAQILLLGGFALLVGVVGISVARAGRSMLISGALARLQDTTAQIRVRGAVVLMIGVVALAERLGLEVILGSFVAGVVLKVIDRDMISHPRFQSKLDAIGYGFLVPVFFITSGLRFDLGALFASGSAILGIPIFLLALLVVRGTPALVYGPLVGSQRAVAAAFLQATSLPFIVAATQIGMELGVVSTASGASLVSAGLLSVLIFPLVGLSVLRRGIQSAGDDSRAAREQPISRGPAQNTQKEVAND